MTLVSRILGFVRDQIIAGVFGASVASDAFFVAFKIPNFFRRLFAEGAFAQAFVPVFTTYRSGDDPREIAGLVDAIFGIMSAAVLATVVVGIVAAPAVIWLFAPGFVHQPGHFALTVSLLRITFPYLLFISLTALFGSVLNTYGRFSIPAVTPALLNVAMIAAALLLSPRLAEPVLGLAFGVLVGGALQLALQFGAVLRLGIRPVPRFDFQHPGVRRILALMAPALFGVSVGQINLLVDTLMA
jgi:putative peptidoglycan lipid II flippase